MKIRITGKDRGDLLPISTDLQFLPVLCVPSQPVATRRMRPEGRRA